MQDARQTQLVWLRKLLDKTRLSPNAIAEKARVNPSTLYRFLDEDAASELRPLTVNRISQAFDYPPPEGHGFASGDATPHSVAAADLIPASKGKLLSFKVTTDALRLAGIEEGDILLVDPDAKPKPGALVCAQVFDTRTGTAETVFRWYEPPYLVAASDAPELRKPLMIDHETVQLRGVVVHQLRSKRVA